MKRGDGERCLFNLNLLLLFVQVLTSSALCFQIIPCLGKQFFNGIAYHVPLNTLESLGIPNGH